MQLLGLFLLVVVFIALIASIYLNVSAQSGAIGRDIQSKQVTMLQDERQIAHLKGQLGVLYSSIEMDRRARAMGFVSKILKKHSTSSYRVMSNASLPTWLRPINPRSLGQPIYPPNLQSQCLFGSRNNSIRRSFRFFKVRP